VQNAIAAANRQTQIDPKSNLPTGRLIEDHLRNLMRGEKAWTYLDIKLNTFDVFSEVYGFVAGDDVVRFTALLMGEVIDEAGTPDDYIGHPGRDNFVVITHSDDANKVLERIRERFNEEIKQNYSFIDRERGYILVPDGANGEKKVDLMTVSIGAVSTKTHQFSDIREITELAAENRRQGGTGAAESGDSQILTSW
jgi:GGDEF domain-containing protein